MTKAKTVSKQTESLLRELFFVMGQIQGGQKARLVVGAYQPPVEVSDTGIRPSYKHARGKSMFSDTT